MGQGQPLSWPWAPPAAQLYPGLVSWISKGDMQGGFLGSLPWPPLAESPGSPTVACRQRDTQNPGAWSLMDSWQSCCLLEVVRAEKLACVLGEPGWGPGGGWDHQLEPWQAVCRPRPDGVIGRESMGSSTPGRPPVALSQDRASLGSWHLVPTGIALRPALSMWGEVGSAGPSPLRQWAWCGRWAQVYMQVALTASPHRVECRLTALLCLSGDGCVPREGHVPVPQQPCGTGVTV